jgi:hypothetical protein
MVGGAEGVELRREMGGDLGVEREERERSGWGREGGMKEEG